MATAKAMRNRSVGNASASPSLAAAVIACMVALTACGGAEETREVRIRRLPPAPLVDAPPTVPDEDLVAGQVVGTAGPVTDEVASMLAASFASDPDVPHTLWPAAVISAEVADHFVGMAFPADKHAPLMRFMRDDRHWEHSSVDGVTFSVVDDPLLLWEVSGVDGDDTESLALVGGWAVSSVATVALQQDGEWIVADTAEVPGADGHGWAVALDDISWITTPFEEVAVYDSGGRLLAASKAAVGVLPRAAAGLRGGGWRSADVGQRFTADADVTGLPHGPSDPVANRTVTIAGYGWAVQLAREQRRLHLGGGPRELARAGDVRVDVAVTRTGLDPNAVVAGAVERGSGGDIVAGGYAADHVATVRIVFVDGAWLAVPTRTAAEAIPEMSSRVWAVAATGTSSEPARVVAHYEALDRHGDVIARVPADPAG